MSKVSELKAGDYISYIHPEYNCLIYGQIEYIESGRYIHFTKETFYHTESKVESHLTRHNYSVDNIINFKYVYPVDLGI